MQPQKTTAEGTTLLPSPQFARLKAHLQDLIIIALERFSERRGRSYSLVRCQYVSDARLEEKCCMHFDALAKDLELGVNIPLRLTLSVETEY